MSINFTYKKIYHYFNYEIRNNKCFLNEYLHHLTSNYSTFFSKEQSSNFKDRFVDNLFFNTEQDYIFVMRFYRIVLQYHHCKVHLHSTNFLFFDHFSRTFVNQGSFKESFERIHKIVTCYYCFLLSLSTIVNR